MRLFLGQFSSPLVLLLVFAVVLSSALGQYGDAALIFGILLLTGAMGFWQEYRASRTVQKLQALVHTRTTVRRSGTTQNFLLEDLVPGAIATLRAGDVVPGDCLLLQGKDVHVNESALTGESFPAEKATVCRGRRRRHDGPEEYALRRLQRRERRSDRFGRSHRPGH